jgi:regulator of protease activity HflC (stomatin/prohibitin superfamily)
MQSLIFDAPISNCPTADNIMLYIDIAVQFRVKNSYENVKKFCFNTNPNELTNMLNDSLSERVRVLVRGKTHIDAYSIKGKESSGAIVTYLNNMFESKGVEIEDVSITDVKLPNDVANFLEEKSAYTCKNDLQRKKQCFSLMEKQDLHSLHLLTQKKEAEMNNERERSKKEIAEVLKEHKYIN